MKPKKQRNVVRPGVTRRPPKVALSSLDEPFWPHPTKPIPRPGDPRYEYLMARHGLAPRLKTYTAKRAQAQYERLLADVAAGCVVEITRRGKAVTSVLSPAKLETLEIMANPEAMRAIRADKAGKLKRVSVTPAEMEANLQRICSGCPPVESLAIQRDED